MWRAIRRSGSGSSPTTAAATILSQSLFRPSGSARAICTVNVNMKKTFRPNTISNLPSVPSRWRSAPAPAPASVSTHVPILAHSRRLSSFPHSQLQLVQTGPGNPLHLGRRRTTPAPPSANYYTSNTHHPFKAPINQHPQQQSRTFSQSQGQQQRRDGGYTYRTFDGRGGGGYGGGAGWGGRGGPGGWRYNRFMLFWGQYRYMLIGGGTAMAGFYVWNLDVVPMTGRRRFNCISNEMEMQLGKHTYDMTVQEYRGRFLPESHHLVRYVDDIFRKLIFSGQPQLGEGDEMLKKLKWKVHVIDSPEMNAFVLPGGNVFVFTGILPICRDKDGLAAVLGHEIAHVLAHHPAERMSSNIVVIIAALAASVLFDVSQNMSSTLFNLMLALPNSRAQESEADEIGLMMMAKSCFKPEAAAGLWSRMHQVEKAAPPQLLSTHPSSRRRMEAIQKWLPQANTVYDDSGCGVTGRYAESFGQAVESFW
ncbi:hypothetical protein GX50_07925 [[Emmonsia] crescens]|uniref:Peptidase M48 domain-containing protein n=1 Tax=[Emmonsia] crescens TaxID=73230 RepID=A0A2B7Z5Y4_9EURO|nr:hypothetical protein GX50_07925 [Emmonsia crescens]